MELNLKKIKILLIDDDEMMRIYFRDIFWIHGKNNKYDVAMVSNLEDAKKRVDNNETRPDLIFLDVIVPESAKSKKRISAYQIARCLEFVDYVKKSKELPKTKIVLYSGHKEDDLKDALLKLGIDGCLVKGECMPKEIVSFTDKIHGSNN